MTINGKKVGRFLRKRLEGFKKERQEETLTRKLAKEEYKKARRKHAIEFAKQKAEIEARRKLKRFKEAKPALSGFYSGLSPRAPVGKKRMPSMMGEAHDNDPFGLGNMFGTPKKRRR